MTDVALSHTSWVDPARLVARWDPAYFSPEYEEVDRELLSHSHAYRTLADLVTVLGPARPFAESEFAPTWVACFRQGSLSFEKISSYTPGTLIPLPAEAIVISRTFSDRAQVAYWDQTIYPGGGAATSAMIALVALKKEPIAWMVRELRSEFFRLQLRRAASSLEGAFRIDTHALLQLKVRVPSSTDEREYAGQMVKDGLRLFYACEYASEHAASARSQVKPFLLTGSTFEERITQFEDYLLEQAFVEPDKAFFVEASSTDRASDLFIVRSLRGSRTVQKDTRFLDLIPQDDLQVDIGWRDWYWDEAPERRFKIFNSFSSVDVLPSHLLARMVPSVGENAHMRRLEGSVLPGFDFFRSIVEPMREADGMHLDDVARQLSKTWLQLHSKAWSRGRLHTSAQAYRPLRIAELSALGDDDQFGDFLLSSFRSVFRPAMGLKVLRDGKTAGVYILFGPDQMEEPNRVRVMLESYGRRLSELLDQPSDFIADAARRESLRRLSGIMHFLSGPIMDAMTALEDLEEFMESHPEVTGRLVPNDEKANRRAQMSGASLESYTVGARIGRLRNGIGEIRKVSYQIRQLKRVQGALAPKKCDLCSMVNEKASQYQGKIHGLRVLYTGLDKRLTVFVDEEALAYALNEVLNNSCRELRERAVSAPTINLHVRRDGENVTLSIQDNALPTDCQLIFEPFKEGSSSYSRSGRGSGLGLAIVHEVFRTHGGMCRLDENRDESGVRLAGVTFTATLPYYAAPQPTEPSYD